MERPHGSLELKRLRAKVQRNRLTKPLFDTKMWVRDMERGLLEAWRLYNEEERTDHIKVANLIK